MDEGTSKMKDKSCTVNGTGNGHIPVLSGNTNTIRYYQFYIICELYI